MKAQHCVMVLAALLLAPVQQTAAAQADVMTVTLSMPVGGTLSVQGMQQVAGGMDSTLELERFQVFTADAKLLADGKELPLPAAAYYRGAVPGAPQSTAVLVVPASGPPQGMILGPAGMWKIEQQQGAPAGELTARKLEQAELEPLRQFHCGATGKELDVRHLTGSGRAASAVPATGEAAAATVSRVARVAVETDYEFYALFNNTSTATSYVGALFAYVSSIYAAETSTSLQVSYLKLWTGGAGSDPWVANTDTLAALNELQAYWTANMGSEQRTITHMLSGKDLGGGIAYIGVLCDSAYGYGVSASLYQTAVDTSKTVWDTMVVSHEIGHNFGSPHTHGYCNVGGNANPVDLCYTGEYGCDGMAAIGLPGIGSLSGGAAGTGNGTIMSYCHSISPGFSNIAMTFGTGHPYGIAASRVPQEMMATVQSSAQAYPGCFALPPSASSNLLWLVPPMVK
jgi:hypothetical protein